MNRRRFVSKSATAGAFAMTATGTLFAKSSVLENGRKIEKTPVEKFKLKYAPHFGTFRENAGKDPADQLKFMSDQGFRAVFDNGLSTLFKTRLFRTYGSRVKLLSGFI